MNVEMNTEMNTETNIVENVVKMTEIVSVETQEYISEDESEDESEIEHLKLLRILASITEYNDISELYDELDPLFFENVIEEIIIVE